MKLHSYALSPPSQLSVLVASHLGLPLEELTVNVMSSENYSEEYKAKNPQAKVPTLIDDDFVLTESMAIIRYLAHKAGETSIYPSDPKHRALVDMHLSNMNDIRRNHILLNYATVIQPNYWTDRPPVPAFLIANLESGLDALFTEYSTLISDKDFVVLDQLTLADFVLAVEMITLVIYEYDFKTKQPNLVRWLTSI